MNKAMLLASYLFDPHRTPARWSVSRSATLGQIIDEAQQFTPGMQARLARIMEARS